MDSKEPTIISVVKVNKLRWDLSLEFGRVMIKVCGSTTDLKAFNITNGPRLGKSITQGRGKSCSFLIRSSLDSFNFLLGGLRLLSDL